MNKQFRNIFIALIIFFLCQPFGLKAQTLPPGALVPIINLILSDDSNEPGLVVDSTDSQTSEAGKTAVFSLRLQSKPEANVSISIASSNTAEGTVAPAAMEFTPANWNQLQTATVSGVDDFVDDGDQPYAVDIAVSQSDDPVYGSLGPVSVSFTNTDNDQAGITVGSISSDTTEAGGTATFSIVLNSMPTSQVSIDLSSSDTGEGTVSPTSIVILPQEWNIQQTVTVTGVDDAIIDGNIGYTIQMATAVSTDPKYAGIDPGSISLLNIDNDNALTGFTVGAISGNTSETGQAATFTVRLNSQPSSSVSINFSSSDVTEGSVSPAGVEFTMVNWNQNQVVTVTGVDDNIVDGDKSYSIVLAAAQSADIHYNGLNPPDVNSILNMDNDTAGFDISAVSGDTTEFGQLAFFIVKLTSEPLSPVTLTVTSSDTGEGSVSPSSVAINSSNWNIEHFFAVTGVDDWVDDGDQTYSLVFSPATSGDGGYNGLKPTDLTLKNIDNDTAGFTIGSISDNTSESGNQATFMATLTSQPVAEVSILLSSSDTTEGAIVTNRLVFTAANWNQSQSIMVTGVDDTIVDGDQGYAILFDTANSGDVKYHGLKPQDVLLTNIDNDHEKGFRAGLMSQSESGGYKNGVFSMRLFSQPTSDVNVSVVMSASSAGVVNPSSLVFNPENWEIIQTVTVTEANPSLAIDLNSNAIDPDYQGRTTLKVE